MTALPLTTCIRQGKLTVVIRSPLTSKTSCGKCLFLTRNTVQINGVQLHVDIPASYTAPPSLGPHAPQQSVAGERDDGENMLAVKLPRVRSDSHYFYSLSQLARTSHVACLEARRLGSAAELEPWEDVGECVQSLYHSVSHQQVTKVL